MTLEALLLLSACMACFVADPFLQGCASCCFSLETDACVLAEKVVQVFWDLGRDFFPLYVGLYPFRDLDGIIPSFRPPQWLSGKESTCRSRRRLGFDPRVGKTPWRRERLPTPVFWPGEFHGLYNPWGRRVGILIHELYQIQEALFCS